MFLGGENAVPDLLRPERLTVYVDDLDPMLPVGNRWRSDGLPNITVRRAFWHSPGGPEKSGGSEDLPAAPWPMVYADPNGHERPTRP